MNERFERLPVSQIHESPLNPRHHYDAKGMEEITESIRQQGIIQPLLVRPNDDGYEIAAGHRRFRGAQAAGLEVVPAIIREMDHRTFLEVLNVENLQREDVHPMDEAVGYQSLIEKAGYDVEGIAARVGKSISYVYQRLKLADLVEKARTAFWNETITAGHAILIARLQPPEQEKAMAEIERRASYLPMSVRDLADWIAQNVHLKLTRAPFRLDDAELVPAAGGCVNCTKRTGASPALFPDIEEGDTCTDPACFQSKVKAQCKAAEAALAAAGEVLKVSTAFASKPKGGALSHHNWNPAPATAKGPDVKQALVVDGPDRGKVITVRITKETTTVSGGKQPDHEAERKRQEEKGAAERAIRVKILDAVLAKVKWPLSRKDFEDLVWAGLDGTDRMDPIAERHGLKDVLYSEAATKLRAAMAKMSNTELARIAVEMLLMDDVDGWLNSEPKELLAAAKRFGVNAAKIRAGEGPKVPATEAVKKTPAKKAPAAQGKKSR